MKKKLSILLISVLLIGCSEKRVLMDKLTNKGTKKSPIYYSEDGLYSGLVYDVYESGQLSWEAEFKDGKHEGLLRSWYGNGQLKLELNFKNGELNGYGKSWDKNGQLRGEGNFKNGKRDGIYKIYDEKGRLEFDGTDNERNNQSIIINELEDSSDDFNSE